jgi:hypothetical protein
VECAAHRLAEVRGGRGGQPGRSMP